MRHFNFEKEDTGFEILTSALAESIRGQHRPWPLYSGGKRVPTRLDSDGIHVRYGSLYSEKNYCFDQELKPVARYCTDWLTALNNK
jgi:hypothetical protein